MNNTLTLQAFLDQQWQDIAELVFNEFNLIEIAYLGDYSFQHYLADNWHAFSINYAVELFGYRIDNGWLPMLDDIIPAGTGRRYWLNYLGLTHLSGAEKNFHLLNSATIAPIGHLRIKQAVEHLPTGEIVYLISTRSSIAMLTFWIMPIKWAPLQAVLQVQEAKPQN